MKGANMNKGYIVTSAIGVVAGASGMALLQRLRTTHGTLRINLSDPEKDTYKFEIDELDMSKKKLVLNIVVEPGPARK
jgi:hypothetical protein